MKASTRVALRFAGGLPLDGRRRTNATWWRDATRPLPPYERTSRWAALAGWKRMAYRWVCVWVTVGDLVVYLLSPVLWAVLDGTAASTAASWATWRVRRWWHSRQHYRQWVLPLHRALSGPLGISPHAAPTYLHVPEDYATTEHPIRVGLPDTWPADPAGRALLKEIVTSKLGLSDVDATYRLAGREPALIVRQAARPPRAVRLEELRALMEAAPEHAPIIGLTHRRQPVAVDLDAESPHVLVSMSTGGGKSVLIRLIAAQALNKGARVIFCDIKRISHKWARGLPGVEYYRTPEEIHHALMRTSAECDRRYEIIEESEEDDPAVGGRTFLVMEEMNATIGKLQKWWNRTRGPEDDKQSPAVDALHDVLFMGRQGKVHVLAVAQLASARSVGGPEARECFATRILARYTVNAWRMLVPEVWPMPRSSRHSGRVQVVLGGKAKETQVGYLTAAESRSWGAQGPSVVAGPEQAYAGGTVPALYLVDTPQQDQAVSLAQAAARGIIPGHEIAKSARKRDPEFPAPIGERKGKGGREFVYAPDDLKAWARNRPKAKFEKAE